MPQKKETQNFETALERIEQIAAQMETGDLRLDDLIGAYEEGLRLLKFCSERLDQAEKRLQTITRDAAGRPQGLAPMPEPEEIQSSTPPQSSGTEQDSGGPEGSPGAVRLF